jgi:hypothetical protein
MATVPAVDTYEEAVLHKLHYHPQYNSVLSDLCHMRRVRIVTLPIGIVLC